jgi:hypothetical protein
MASDKPQYYWDACMFYEVLGDEPVTPQKRAAVEEFLAENKDNANVLLTSVVSHLEVVPSKLEAKKPGAGPKYLAMFDGERIVEVEINRNILARAREIKDFYYRGPSPGPVKVMDTVDAIHLATATIYGVKEFHTRDDDQKGTKVPLVSLYTWSGIDKVCGKWPLKIVSPENEQGALNLEQASNA